MSDGPRVLWLARMMPVPLNAGDRIYTARLVEAVARAGGNVHVLGLSAPDAPGMEFEVLDSRIRWEAVPGKPLSDARAMFSHRPVVAARYGTPAYRRRLTELLGTEQYDAIVLDQYGLSWALPVVRRYARGNPRIAHVALDFETDVTRDIAASFRGNPLRRLALILNARRTAQAERELAAASDLVVTLTEHDAEQFRRLGNGNASLVLAPGYDGPRLSDRRLEASLPRRVGIVGSYQWTAKQINLADFLAVGDPIFAEAGIELAVVGDMPTAFKAAWTPRLRATRFLGFVDDLAAFLASCRMGLVIEAVGGGFKLKVLDYVFTGTPVAALSAALSGQADEVVQHFLLADDGATLARKIVTVIDKLDVLDAAQRAAYAAAASRYDWDVNGQRLLAALSNR
jgi:polysaccharide biosynthesis protein PslH